MTRTLEQVNVKIDWREADRVAPPSPASQIRKIVAILPRGESIRNFVYSDALDYLAQKADLSVLSVLPNEELADLLRARYEDVHQLTESRDRWLVRIQTELLDMTHGRWLWSEAARERWRLRDRDANTTFRRLKRIGKKVCSYPFANRVGLELLTKLHAASCSRLRTSDEYVRLFSALQPALVFNSSHVHSVVANQAIAAARSLKIPTATFIFSWDNLTSQGRIMLPYDYYIVWNQAIKRQLLQIYHSVKPENVYVTGTPQFDFHFRPQYYLSREDFCRRIGADPSRPIILYSTGMANHMPGETSIVEGIASIVDELTEFGPPQLLVRVYPKDRTGRFDYLKEKYPHVLFPEVPWEPAWLTPKIEDATLLTNTLRHASVGINVASTVSLELCMFDKPVINVGYNPPETEIEEVDYARYYSFDHYKPVVESGAVEVAGSAEELRRLLVEALANPHRRSMQRKSLLRDFFENSLDGRSSSRVARVLEMLASNRIQSDRTSRSLRTQ